MEKISNYLCDDKKVLDTGNVIRDCNLGCGDAKMDENERNFSFDSLEMKDEAKKTLENVDDDVASNRNTR